MCSGLSQKWWKKNCSGGSASAAAAARRVVTMAMKEVAVMTEIWCLTKEICGREEMHRENRIEM
ncbi:hypothetical protein YC2023_093745 [Brassica napus]